MVSGQQHAPAAFHPRKRPGTHSPGAWVGPRAGLDRCGKSRPHRDSIPDRPNRSQSLYRLKYLPEYKVNVKVKQSHYRLGQAQRVPGV